MREGSLKPDSIGLRNICYPPVCVFCFLHVAPRCSCFVLFLFYFIFALFKNSCPVRKAAAHFPFPFRFPFIQLSVLVAEAESPHTHLPQIVFAASPAAHGTHMTTDSHAFPAPSPQILLDRQPGLVEQFTLDRLSHPVMYLSVALGT